MHYLSIFWHSLVIKEAYPNYDEYMPMSTVYNLERWTNALKDVYVKVRLGMDKTAAIDEISKDWSTTEKFNFTNWMKYYESGEIFKYKIANNYYVNEDMSYYLPNPPAKHSVPSPIKTINEIAQEADHIANRVKPGLSKEEEDAANDAFRRKLISRLNSLEKYLGTNEGFLFSGKEYDNFLRSIHELKRKIHTHGKIAMSTQTCIDLLVREAGILNRKNCPVGANVMIKLAQQTPGNTGDLAMGAIPAGGSIPQGLGSLDTPTPNLTQPPSAAKENEETPSSGMEGFLDNLEGGGITEGDELELDDSPKDIVVMDEDEVEVNAFVNESDSELVVMSQLAEGAPQTKDRFTQTKPKTEGKVEVDNVQSSDFDALVNSAFDKLTMEDLLKKLQDINLIFKKKEINRQLALADLMLSRLGLTPYFSNFSEVQQKNLDCLNYSATRMDDIISTLQSGLGKGKIDLTEGDRETDPQAQLLQRHLENEEKKEKDRKEMRKEINNQKLQQEEKPEIEVENPGLELAEAPVQTGKPIEQPKPTPAPGV